MKDLSFLEIDEVSAAGLARTVSTAGTITGFAAIGLSVGGPLGGVVGAMLGAGICYGYFNYVLN